MKAIVQERYGSPDFLALQEIDRPAVGEDQVLVAVRAASVNAADWHLMRRLPHLIGRLAGMPASRVRGVDLAGHVAAVGGNVSRFEPGDEVFGAGLGSFAEYATSTEDRLAAKPRNLGFEEAAALPVAGCTALQGLRDTARVAAGQRVVVYGAGGGVGTFAVQIAKALGAHVTAVSCAGNLELLRSLGADEVVDYASEDFTRRGERYDVLFDLGANRSFADCRRVLAPNGRHVLAGAPAGLGAALLQVLAVKVMPRRGARRASFMARVRHDDLVVLKQLAESGRLSPVIGRRYPLAEVPVAIRHLGTRRARGKVVITFD
jgi:NADPH:quinone reductase-like Zn-dependent oxidoreductase